MGANGIAGTFLSGLGDELGHEGLAFDAEGAVTLILTGGLALELRVLDAGGAIQLHCALAGSGDALPDSFLRRCLAGNFLWLGTRGATLLVEPGGGFRVHLRHRIDLEAADYAAFRAAFDGFLNAAAGWQRECLAAGGQGAPTEAPAAAAEPLLILRV